MRHTAIRGLTLPPGFRLPEGVLVKLNTPSGLPVSLDYSFDTTSGNLSAGTVAFAPGETVKQVPPPTATGYDWVQMSLSHPTGATLTGITSVGYTNPALKVSFGVATNILSLATFTNGLPVTLNALPPAQGATVDFTYEGNGSVLTNGTLTFPQGQTSQQLMPPSVNTQSFDMIRVTVSNPVRTALGSPSTIYYMRTAAPPTPANVTLLPRGAWWKYYDTVTNAMPGWAGTNYDDSAWTKGGYAPLGYGNSPTETTTVGYGGDSNNKFISTYFRTTFLASNVTGLASLTFNLRRDDGAVVYLNGAEVYRDNMPASTIAYTTTATTNNSGPVNTFNSTNFALVALSQPLHEGTNLLAVEIHQANKTSGDIVMNLEVIGNPVIPPPPPVPVIVSPSSAQRFGTGVTVQVSVSATNVYTNMSLYADTVKVGTDVSWPFTFDVAGLTAGSHDLIALGSDAAGNTLASDPVTIEVIPDLDTDGDGIPDAWELAHGLNPTNANDGATDADGDGLSNLAEFIAGTDPHNPTSTLKVATMTIPGAPGTNPTLSFEAVGGKSYSLEYADTLSVNSWNWLTNIMALGTNQVISEQDPSATNSPRRYYRIVTPAR